MTFRCSFFAACCLVPVIAFCEPPSIVRSNVMPQRVATISFDHLCVAQLSRDRKSLHLEWPEIATEFRTKEVNVTLTRTETRTRTIKVDGRSVPETYTVTVPYTETREVTSQVLNVVGMHEAEISIEQVRAWTLTGRALDLDELIDRLNLAKHVFAYTMPNDKDFEELDPFYARVMDDEALVIYVDTTAFQIGESPDMTRSPIEPPTPPPAPPIGLPAIRQVAPPAPPPAK